jgi:hypothetical protein
MHECCIVFAHHKNDAVTRKHYELLVANNPFPVVPVHCNSKEFLDGAIDVGAFQPPPTHDSNYRSGDQMLLRLFQSGVCEAERYVFIEWDVHASMGIRDFYDLVWDAGAAATSVKEFPDPFWHWFGEVRSIPGQFRKYVCGMAPFNGTFYSRRALEAIADDSSIDVNVYCELRIATLLRKNGFHICQMPWWEETNKWFELPIPFDENKPWIYHPVKKYPVDASSCKA